MTSPAGFGPDGVFMDIDDIPPGVDFREVIDDTVGACRFFLAVIGPRWVTPRLQHPGDFVRSEIEAALRRGIPLVPVLVDGASMPKPEELPECSRPMVFLNATTLRPGRSFATDIEQLVKGLRRAEEWKKRKKAAATATPLADPLVPLIGAEPKLVVPAPQPVRKAGDPFTLDLPGGLKMPFAWCPPGTFQMGSPKGEKDRSDNELQHEVRLTKGFYMGVHPVTRGEFARFVQEMKYKAEAETSGGGHKWTGRKWELDPNTNWRNPGFAQVDSHPVTVVSWNGAKAFADWLADTSGKAVRLPTEAEWEYAARGGTHTPFYWGAELNGTQANCDGNHPYGTSTNFWLF